MAEFARPQYAVTYVVAFLLACILLGLEGAAVLRGSADWIGFVLILLGTALLGAVAITAWEAS